MTATHSMTEHEFKAGNQRTGFVTMATKDLDLSVQCDQQESSCKGKWGHLVIRGQKQSRNELMHGREQWS